MTEPQAVSVLRVSKTFGSTVALDRVSLDVHQGEVIVLVGASGSGKSTLLRCINYLEAPDSGEVYIAGEQIGERVVNGKRRRLGERSLARQRAKIGMVFQHFNLYPHMSAERNITTALTLVRKIPPRRASQIAIEMMERVGLPEMASRFPGQLSGGQQQRVAIARALALNPEVMLLDEPTSALDPETIGEVLQVMQALAATGMTMLVATHEMGFARHVADRVVFMQDGAVVEDTPSAEFFTEPKSDRARGFLSKLLHPIGPEPESPR